MAVGAAVKGATSLVELILKKWGDDTAGAAKELEQKVGFPESVANRIVTGELPMDEASRVARAQEQGYGPVLYRGHANINAPRSDQDMWLTDSKDVARTYANASMDRFGSTVTPLRTNADYHGPGNLAYVRGDGKMHDRVTTNSIKNPGIRQGIIKGTDDIAEAVKESGQYQGTHFRNIKDEFHTSSSTDPSDVYNILGSRPDVNIRHADAAYDPQYSGPNIMGGLLAGGVGLGALGQSEDADAGFVTKGGKTLLEAFHGSPHKFDKFSMDQIGTGEGAQAFGHGLYFADEIDVAKGYQPRDRANEDWMYEQYKAAEEAGDQYMMDAWERAMMHDSPMELRASAADPDYDEYSQAAFAEVADALSANPGAGSLTRAEIDVTPESLLDWDKPLSEQSEAVQGFMNRVAERAPFDGTVRNADGTLEPDASGRMLYEWLYGQKNGPNMTLMDRQANTSRALSKNGIKGIKYLDGNSRNSVASWADGVDSSAYDPLAKGIAENYLESANNNVEKALGKLRDDAQASGAKQYADAATALEKGDLYPSGTSNYVIFDDSLINIAERGNADPRLLGATAAGTAGLLAAPALMRGEPTSPEERGFASWEEVSRDPTAPLPAPTLGEAMGKAGSTLMHVLGLPMTGLQGIARGGYGLLTGEEFTEAAAQAGNTMDVGWRDGLLDVSGMNPDKGADQAAGYVTDKTGDESLGWMVKMGLLFGGL